MCFCNCKSHNSLSHCLKELQIPLGQGSQVHNIILQFSHGLWIQCASLILSYNLEEDVPPSCSIANTLLARS